MTRLVVSWPVLESSRLSPKTLRGWPEAWGQEGVGLVRQVGRLGNRSYSRAEVSRAILPEMGQPFFSGVNLVQAVQVRRRRAFNLIVCVFDCEANSSNVDELRRPGVLRLQNTVRSVLGIELDPTQTVFATSIRTCMQPLTETKDGLLEVDDEIRAFRFDVTYSLLAAAIGAERMILEAATVPLPKLDFMAFEARRNLGLIKNWLTTPSTDSTSLLREVSQLRESLGLDSRRTQLQRSLEHEVRAADFAGAAFIASAGLCATLLPAVLNLSWRPAIDFPALVGIVLGVALASGVATWFISHRA